MSSLRPIIAGNGLAIALTIIFVLPITGVLAYIITSPVDGWMTQLGTWLHETRNWSFATFDAEQRFAKIGLPFGQFLLRLVFRFYISG